MNPPDIFRAGTVLLENSADAEALDLFARVEDAFRREPEYWLQRGSAHRNVGNIGQALSCFDMALKLDPGHVQTRYAAALLHLTLLDFGPGWRDYEIRRKTGEWITSPRAFHFPEWDYSTDAIEDKTLFIYGEQGLGDEIMFLSILPDFLNVYSRTYVVIECASSLEALLSYSLSRFSDRVRIVARQPEKNPLAFFKPDAPVLEIPAGSLPRLMRPTFASFKDQVNNFLRPSAKVLSKKLIGLSWRGGTSHTRTVARSLTLQQLRPLFDALPAGFKFLSLQYDAFEKEEDYAREHDLPIVFYPFDYAFSDLEKMAALMCQCELVISTCSTTVHLAGALGKRCLCLAPHVPEWRYGLHGDRMCWYPSVEILRQPYYRGWQPVIEDTARAVAIL